MAGNVLRHRQKVRSGRRRPKVRRLAGLQEIGLTGDDDFEGEGDCVDDGVVLAEEWGG